jgi:outer membrane protein TolC
MTATKILPACPCRQRPARRLALVALPALLLGACSIRPEPITPPQHFARAEADYNTLYASYVPVSGPLTLAQALARALKYNYDAQLAKTQMTLQEQQLDLAMTQMLPRLAATAGYNHRSNDNAAESVSELTRQRSLVSSFSEEPSHGFASLEFSWNMLDLGVSYFQAKQQGDRTYIAVERRRKVINSITKSVEEAYWKAVTADRLLPRVRPLLAQAERVLAASRNSRRAGVAPQLQTLDFEQAMLTVVGQLRRLQTDLASAKVQLAALINVPADAPLALAQPDRRAPSPMQDVNFHQLEEIGLAMRPELREEAYQERIDRQDVYKEIIKMLPGIGILGNLNYDSNRYLFNPTWGAIGAQATFNLVNLVQGPKAIAAAETSVDVSHMRRLALSVAVLTQVNLSYQEYLSAQQDLDTAQQIVDVQHEITTASHNAEIAQTEPESERIRRDMSALIAELSRDRALAAVHAALASLYISLGVDLVPPSVDNAEALPTLSEQVNQAISGWEAGRLPKIELPPAAAPAGTPVSSAAPAVTPVAAVAPVAAPAPVPAAVPHA